MDLRSASLRDKKMDLAGATGFVQATCERKVVIPRMKVADTLWVRGLGLMGKGSVPVAYGEGLFFPKCRSLHTCFMRFSLHMIFLDAGGQVLEVREGVGPWRIAKGPRGTHHCAETALDVGSVRVGAELVWETVQ